MNPFNPYRILRYVDDIPALKGDDNGPRPGDVKPRMLLIYPSMTCNQKCEYCYYIPMHEKAAFMSEKMIAEIMRDSIMMGIEGVELCGGGEPLLHPASVDYLGAGIDSGLKFGVLTHAAVPRKHDLFTLIGEHFSYFRVSMDYGDPEFYATTRGTHVKMFEWAIENIKTALHAREEYNDTYGEGSSNCLVSIKATVWKQTPEQICELAYLGKRLGVDSIQFKRADQVSGGMEQDRSRHNAISETLENLKRDPAMPPIMYNFGKTKLTHKCWITPIHAFVETDGDVHLCCYYEGRHDTHKIGNVKEQSLIEIWGSSKHVAAIKNVDTDICNEYACRFIGYMKTLDEAVDDDLLQLQFV